MTSLSPLPQAAHSANQHRPLASLSLLALAAVGALAVSCSVPLANDAEQESTQNVCEKSSECGDGVCRGGLCQTSGTDLPVLLLNVTPPSGVPVIAGISFTSVVEEFELGPNGYEIKLGNVARVKGTVSGVNLSGEHCLLDADGEVASESKDDSLPVRVTLTPRERLLGLPSPSHTATVQGPQGSGDGSYEFSLNVPPGRYDIYIEPLATDDGCVRPPYLVIDQEIKSGWFGITTELPNPEPLGVTIRYPKNTDDLSGFMIDIVESDTGRILSNRARLGEPVETEEGLEYTVQLAFSEIEGDEGAPAAELVRLSPPADVVAPTLLVERSVVDLFQGGEGLIDQLTDIPEPVRFGSRVTKPGSPIPIQSTVVLVATELQGIGPGTIAAFSRTVETDEQGYFEVDLLPGNYRMSAEPFDSNRARTEVELTVTGTSDTQIGRTIEVKRRQRMEGRVVSFTGAGVAGAPMWASAVLSNTALDLIDEAQGLAIPYPTAVGTASEPGGDFSILADRGNYHVAARPESSTGFAWRVRLGVDASEGDVDLGRIKLPLPVVVDGVLTSDDRKGKVVPGALIRAYAFIKDRELVDSPEEAESVIAVAESRTDSEGRYRLLLPEVFK